MYEAVIIIFMQEHSASKQGPQCRCEESLGGPSEVYNIIIII